MYLFSLRCFATPYADIRLRMGCLPSSTRDVIPLGRQLSRKHRLIEWLFPRNSNLSLEKSINSILYEVTAATVLAWPRQVVSLHLWHVPSNNLYRREGGN